MGLTNKKQINNFQTSVKHFSLFYIRPLCPLKPSFYLLSAHPAVQPCTSTIHLWRSYVRLCCRAGGFGVIDNPKQHINIIFSQSCLLVQSKCAQCVKQEVCAAIFNHSTAPPQKKQHISSLLMRWWGGRGGVQQLKGALCWAHWWLPWQSVTCTCPCRCVSSWAVRMFVSVRGRVLIKTSTGRKESAISLM